MLIEPPRTLPVHSLSPSSVALFRRDPEKWRRRYILGEYEPTTPSQLLGTAIHRAEADNFQEKIDTGRDRLVAHVLDTFSDEWDAGVEEATGGRGIRWEDDKPGKVKDSGTRVLGAFHRRVAPEVKPVAVEREYEVLVPDVDWTFRGYLDLEQREGPPGDLKVRGERGPVGADEASKDIQATAALFARRAEGTESLRFDFFNLVRAEVITPRHLVVTPALRTENQLDAFLGELYRIAAEIHFRLTYEVWDGARPGDPCSPRYCGFWRVCRFGGQGLLRGSDPAPVRSPRPSDVMDAVRSTARKDGTTTAERVSRHLGIPTRSAGARLGAAVRRGQLDSEPPTKRFKTKPPVVLPGPRTYRLPEPSLEPQLRESLEAVAA